MPSKLSQKIDRLCAYDHCRIALPWFAWHHATDNCSRLHRHIAAIDFGRPDSEVGLPTKCAAAVVHAFRGTRDIIITWRRMRTACHAGYGISPGRQLLQLFVSTFRYNHPAKLYYATRLFRLKRHRWLSVFSHGELTFLLGQFESRGHKFKLWRKQGWAEFAQAHDIPTPRVAATAGPDGVHILHPELLVAGRDLFAKPDVDYSSRGGLMLEWDQAAQGWHALGAHTGFVEAESLLAFLQTLTQKGKYIIQPRLRNSADISDLSTRALVNARVVTLRAQDGSVSILMAALRLPPGDQPTSDVVGSTFSVEIDPETGLMNEAECAKLQLGSSPCHPFNGAVLKNRKIAAWEQMRTLALASHAKMPFMPAIGWDLVSTNDGVFILEANAIWNAYLGQQWGRSPLGETHWPQVMLDALAAGEITAHGQAHPLCGSA